MRTYKKIVLSIAILMLIITVGIQYYKYSPFNSKSGMQHIPSVKKVFPKITRLQVSGPFVVLLKKGDMNMLAMHADPKMLEYIETTLINGELRVSAKEGVSLSSINRIQIEIQSNNIDAVVIQDKADFIANDLSQSRLSLKARGNARALLAGRVEHLETKLCDGCRLDMVNLSTTLVDG